MHTQAYSCFVPDRNISIGFQNTTDRRAIRKVFKRFRGSGRWAARRGHVMPGTVSKWLRGGKVSNVLDSLMPLLAQELIDTDGACIHDVNGPSVRSRLGSLRRKPRKGDSK